MATTPRVPGSGPDDRTLLRLIRLHQAGEMTQAELARRFGHRGPWVKDQLRRVAPSSSHGLRLP